MADLLPEDADGGEFSRDGRVMEMLSEHTLLGWLEGYLLTGRHGLFHTYEAFAHVIDSMFNQHAKWLDMCKNHVAWRAPFAVGLAFAVAAATFAPLLMLGVWWRRLSTWGAMAGLVVGGAAATGWGDRLDDRHRPGGAAGPAPCSRTRRCGRPRWPSRRP